MKTIDIQLHQAGHAACWVFVIRKITGAVRIEMPDGKKKYVGNELTEDEADYLANSKNCKVSVMNEK
jgi:hypothetical protein